jgi:hypothetical protein
MDDFEQFLTSQPLRDVPPAWREEILATAATTTMARETPPPSAAGPWWRAWLWPSPYAWAALAAAWLVIFGLNFAAQTGHNRDGPRGPALSDQQIYALLAERRQLEEFYSQMNTPPAPPPPVKLPNSPGASLDQPKPEKYPLA